MREDWTECCFEDLLDYEQPTKYIVKSTKYNDKYKIPVLTAGKTFIKGYTNETDGIFDNLPTIIFDDFTTASQFVNFQFKVKSSAMKILVPTSKLVNMQFVYYAMQVNQVRSDTHKRYWISVFSKKKFLLPPLVEQQAIVKKIEELFSSLDSGIADLKKAQEQLVIYRQAVLKKAFEGELTKEWREKQTDIKEWGEIKLGKIFKVSSGKSLTSKNMTGKGYPVYGGNGISGYHSQFNFEEKKLIIGRVGVKCGVTHITENKCWVTDNALVVNIFEPKNHLLKFLKLKLQFENLNKLSNSTAQPVISGTKIYSYVVKMPKPKEQHQIVQEIESRLSVCDAVEQNINDSLEKAQALRQSILKKAFEGKLLSEEEIAACKQHKDYEPASVLLEKIKAEKK